MDIEEYILKAKKTAVFNVMMEALDIMQGYNNRTQLDAIRSVITENGEIMSIRRINEVFG